MLHRIKTQIAIAVALFIAFSGSAAVAAPITFNFEAELESGPSDFAPFFGTNLSGSYTFESTTADGNISPTIGFYTGALSNFFFTTTNSGLGNTTTGSAASGNIGITNNGTGGPVCSAIVDPCDRYAVLMGPGDGVQGTIGNNVALTEISLNLLDSDQTVFSNDLLPQTPPTPLSEYEDNTLQLTYGIDGNVTYKLTSLTAAQNPSEVPTPATWMLMVAGLLGLGFKARLKNPKA